jgi:hypothetical protein
VTTCQEIQEWSETVAPQLAKEVAERVRSGGLPLLAEVNWTMLDTFPAEAVTEDPTFNLRKAAVAWKACAELTAYYAHIGDGWAEVYHRELKRMFEEA